MNPEQPFLKEDPRVTFEAIAQDIARMGANDVEPSQIENLRQQMQQGLKTPQEALEKLLQIRNSKQDYH